MRNLMQMMFDLKKKTLDHIKLDLPDILEYTGEFGPELVLFLPFCNWLSKEGLIKDRKISTYKGMRCFYEGIECAGIIEKKTKRKYISVSDRPSWMPIKDEHTFHGLGMPSRFSYPDLRSKFIKRSESLNFFSSDKPLLVVHNKYNDEWNNGPINYISLDSLDRIFKELKRDYQIVYIRHSCDHDSKGYSQDENTLFNFDDKDILSKHPEVADFNELYHKHLKQNPLSDVNEFKNILYARCYYYITSQGGGAHQIALFKGSIMLILHKRGEEKKWAYRDGYYGFMADIPPIRLVVSSDEELLCSLPLFHDTWVAGGRVHVNSSQKEIITKFSV